MYEYDSAKHDHNNNLNQISEYTEMESSRNVDAYARFKRLPYYFQYKFVGANDSDDLIRDIIS